MDVKLSLPKDLAYQSTQKDATWYFQYDPVYFQYDSVGTLPKVPKSVPDVDLESRTGYQRMSLVNETE